MGRSPRNYWSPFELLEDIKYWSTKTNYGAAEKVKASWAFLRMAWGVPPSQSIDDFVLDEIEGRGHKFVRKHRFIEERY